MKITEVIFRQDLYPRFEPNQATIQKYANSIDFLPPILVNQNNILIDGFHRWKAHQLAGAEEVKAEIIEATENEVLILSYKTNSHHGLQLSNDEKKSFAIKQTGILSVKEISEIISVSERTVRGWTENKRKELDEERNNKILADYLRAWNTQESIAKIYDLSHTAIQKIIDTFATNGKIAESCKDFKPLLYNIWNLQKQDNAVDSHFGSFPQYFMENLLHYHTEPLDVVFDCFAGGGTTVDACKKMMRRYYCSDRVVKPGREADILQADIKDGIKCKKIDLAFIDPPYWLQAKGKYSKDDADLGNMTLEHFNKSMCDIIKDLEDKKAKKIAIVIQPTQYANKFKLEDHIFDFAKFFSDKYEIEMRYILPYSSQQYTPQCVNAAKDEKKCLVLNRDLVRMTRKRNDSHSTEFGMWLREQQSIASEIGFVASNIDFMWRNYKTGQWLLLEEKRYNRWPAFAQENCFRILHNACKSDKKYCGFHLLVFEKTSPDDGWIKLNGKTVTSNQLISFLQFAEIPPSIY